MDFGRINSQPPATQTPATTETQQTATPETATGDSRTLEQQQSTPQPATQSHRQSRMTEARFGEIATRSALEMQLEGNVTQSTHNPANAQQLHPSASRTSGPGALICSGTHRDIPGNLIQMTGPVGPGQRNDPRDVSNVQQRLQELGVYGGHVDGQFTQETEEAIRSFQSQHEGEIRGLQADAQQERFAQHGFGRNSPQMSTPGSVGPNDATAQALHNTFPRLVGGRLRTEPEAYDYYANQVRVRSLPFNENETNIVGIRGYQAGQVHNNEGSGLYRNQYNDTMVMLSRDDEGRPHVREFRATLDPGAHQGVDGVDPRTRQLSADQQITYQLSNGATSHADRPGLFMQTGEGVIRPGQQRGQEGLDTREQATYADGRPVDRYGGLMIHAGGGEDNVRGSSYGCQVVNGNWYPSFWNELERNAGSRQVQYTVLNGDNLTE